MRTLCLYLSAVAWLAGFYWLGAELAVYLGDASWLFIAGLFASEYAGPVRKAGKRAGAAAYHRITKRRARP